MARVAWVGGCSEYSTHVWRQSAHHRRPCKRGGWPPRNLNPVHRVAPQGALAPQAWHAPEPSTACKPPSAQQQRQPRNGAQREKERERERKRESACVYVCWCAASEPEPARVPRRPCLGARGAFSGGRFAPGGDVTLTFTLTMARRRRARRASAAAKLN